MNIIYIYIHTIYYITYIPCQDSIHTLCYILYTYCILYFIYYIHSGGKVIFTLSRLEPRTPIPGYDEGLYGQNPKDYTGENPDISSQFCYRLSGSGYSRNILWKHRVYVCVYIYIYGGVLKWEYPIAGCFIMENPVKWMIWGYPYFRKPPCIYIYIYIYKPSLIETSPVSTGAF